MKKGAIERAVKLGHDAAAAAEAAAQDVFDHHTTEELSEFLDLLWHDPYVSDHPMEWPAQKSYHQNTGRWWNHNDVDES